MSASVLRFPHRVPRCEHCGWLVPRGTATESIHHKICTQPQQKAAAYLVPPKPKRDPAPSLKTRRRAALRQRLADDQSLIRIVVRARLKIRPEQLHRVAEGRSDFSPTTWKRLDPYLGVAP